MDHLKNKQRRIEFPFTPICDDFLWRNPEFYIKA